MPAQPSLIDHGFRLAYRAAYQLMRVYWTVVRPDTHGALVALWHGGKVLLIKNSYVSYYSLPGGYVGRNETGREAAIRELREEVGIQARVEQLEPLYDETKDWEGKRDHVEIFGLELDEAPNIAVDNREVVAAEWLELERALELDLFPPLRRVIEQRLERHSGSV